MGALFAWLRYSKKLLSSNTMALILEAIKVTELEEALGDYEYSFTRSEFGDTASVTEMETSLAAAGSSKAKKIIAILNRPKP